VESQLNRREEGGRALAIFPGALGDFVCFLPALDYLARGRAADLLARTEYGDLVPASIRAGSIERREIARLFVAGADLREAEKFFQPYDEVYSWSGGGDAVFRANFARVAGAKGRLFPFRPAASRPHITDYYLGCVGAPPGGAPTIVVKPEALEWVRKWLDAHGFGINGNIRSAVKGNLLVAPGSGAPEKNWPREFFREIIDWRRASGGKVAVVLGPAEEGEIQFWTECAPVARDLTLAQLGALLSLSGIYLGNDSGVTHLAAAVGATTLALFGPTDPAQWAPHGARVTVARLGVECSPCDHGAMKNCSHHKCLETFAPQDIILRLERLMRQNTNDFRLLDKGVGRH
jgi:hypothetical protein